MALEVAVGIISHSLALLSDAAHMLTDAAAIGLSLVALRLAARPARGAMTFGLKRTEILSAQFNGATLLVLALLIIYEGITRLLTSPPVAGAAVLGLHARANAEDLLRAPMRRPPFAPRRVLGATERAPRNARKPGHPPVGSDLPPSGKQPERQHDRPAALPEECPSQQASRR